jgi:dethiobiotin synthetase/malonyl-CoA O-methyltransferase
MRGLFVTGTGTDVGKSWVAAWAVKSWGAAYWKPVQSGTDEGWDSDLVRLIAPRAKIFESRHAFPQPLSPDQAARRAGDRIELDDFALPAHDGALVVEGAGGVLVPLNEQALMIDLMARLGLPVLVVAKSGLGTINHTLLSLEALRARKLEIAGVVMVGPPHADNRAAIEKFGRTGVVAELPPLPDLAALAAYPPLAWRPF